MLLICSHCRQIKERERGKRQKSKRYRQGSGGEKMGEKRKQGLAVRVIYQAEGRRNQKPVHKPRAQLRQTGSF